MKYFTIAELCKSETADRLGIDNRCKKEHVSNMTALVNNVLDPLREAYGKPIRVNVNLLKLYLAIENTLYLCIKDKMNNEKSYRLYSCFY